MSAEVMQPPDETVEKPVKQHGVYAVLFTADCSSILLPALPPEDQGKLERVILGSGAQVMCAQDGTSTNHTQFEPLVPEIMYSGVSGGVEHTDAENGISETTRLNDAWIWALIREAWEERWLVLQASQVQNGWPEFTVVQHRLGKGEVQFTVHGHTIILTEEQRRFLTANYEYLEISLAELQNFLETKLEKLRPFMRYALQQALLQGLLGTI